jgi:ADP-ribose pyrophosphatase YjhB (NUDIX family)
VAAGTEVRRYAAEGGQESLRVTGGGEAFHGTFALPGGLVEFSPRLFRYFENRCSIEGITRRCAAP